MNPRQRAKTQGISLKVAWQGIPWKKVQRHVFRLQKRIYRATQRGEVRVARKLQKLLVKSWYARLLAVRRISQDNRGKNTAGVDGVKSLTPAGRWRLANGIRLDGKATPLRRTWIPKRGSNDKRPLGIPTQHERARQEVTAALMMGIGCTGVHDRDGTRTPVRDWPSCSRRNTGAVACAGCSSNMTTGLRWITSMGIAAIRATPICKRSMDTAAMRKRGSIKTISRLVCVTSIKILRSGVHGNGHAPIWSSGGRSDPSTDCNCLPHASLRQALPEPEPTNGNGSARRWQPRTPAMAAGLTDHVWTLREVLLFRVPPWPQPQAV